MNSWQSVKICYAEMIKSHPNKLIAESFYNSVFSRVFGHVAIRSNTVFTGVEHLDAKAIKADEVLIEFSFQNQVHWSTTVYIAYFDDA